MDAVMLSRIQFGLTAGFHFIFPPLTLGLTLILLVLEGTFYRTGSPLYEKLSIFVTKILALVFVMGVASGIVLEFSFGTNWSTYSRMVGDIFGAPLAAEGIFSFFLESIFLGILVFGRNRVSRRAYLVSVFLVFFASHLSGLWIIIANSWMQTPAGYVIEGGRAVLTDFFAAALNHSTIQRFTHTIVGGWITGSLFLAGVAAWYLLRNRDVEAGRVLLRISLIVFIITAVLQFGTGHAHAVQVARTQPAKMAAFEALWESQNGAPMSIIGIPDQKARKTHAEIAVPKLLSLLVNFDPDSRVQGLDEIPDQDEPPVLPVYMTYHGMIGLGSLFALIALAAAALMATKRLYDARWFLRALLFAIPLPFISNELGWMAAEIGRQPWAVQGVLRTADAASVVVPPWQILFTIIMFSVIFLLIFAVFIRLLVAIVRKGPDNVTLGYIGE